MKIAATERLLEPEVYPLLPTSWNDLYILAGRAKKDKKVFNKAVEEKLLSPEITRKEINQLFKKPDKADKKPSGGVSNNPDSSSLQTPDQLREQAVEREKQKAKDSEESKSPEPYSYTPIAAKSFDDMDVPAMEEVLMGLKADVVRVEGILRRQKEDDQKAAAKKSSKQKPSKKKLPYLHNTRKAQRRTKRTGP